MDVNFTPTEFTEHFQKYHPEVTERECNVILALVTDTIMSQVREETNNKVSNIDLCNAVVEHTHQFVTELPLDKRQYDILMGVAKRVLLESAYSNS